MLPRYTVLIPWNSPYHSPLQYMAQILKPSCVNQKKSFGTSAASLLSGIPGLSGPCFLAARYSLFFLQHCSQRALFDMAGSRRHLVQRPFSLACCRISRCLRLYSSDLASRSMRGMAGTIGGGHSPGFGFMTMV